MIAIPPGESAKTLGTAEHVWRELAHAGMTRADHVVALGGGVVGDLAGFCAATYQRGVPVVQVPTTLVAPVDAAYGGKTGVDLPEAKNYVGAYHQPAAVIVDPQTLRTLPNRGAKRGVGGGAEDRADRRRRTVGAGCTRSARGGPDERDDPRLRAPEARGRRPGRARRRPSPGAQPRAHGRPRDRDRHRLRALPPRRGGRARPARRPAPAPVRSTCAPRCASCWARRGLPVRAGGGELEEVVAAVAHDKKRLGASRTPFVLVEAPVMCGSAARWPRTICTPRSSS